MSALADLMDELAEGFDIEDGEDGPVPNRYMRLYCQAEAAREEHARELQRAKELQAGAEKQAAEFLSRALRAEAALKDASTYPSNDAKGNGEYAQDGVLEGGK